MRRTALLAASAALVAGVLAWPADAAPSSFVHPGVTVSKGQLDFTRSKVNSGAQPWKGAFDRMMASKYADLNRTPEPRAVVECGSYSNPNHGCTDEREDAIAAYTQALAWYITRDERHARKAIELMDAWSAVIAGPHQQQRAPADRLGRLLLAQGRRDHQSTRTPGPGRTPAASPPCSATSTSPR
ncbi:hypothetical protein SPURM210S_07996 [Streptomyces purpurascens]